MATKQITVYLCVDQHGNYRAIGSNQITLANAGQAIAIIEDDLKKEGVTTLTTVINAMVNLPDEPAIEPDNASTENVESVDIPTESQQNDPVKESSMMYNPTT